MRHLLLPLLTLAASAAAFAAEPAAPTAEDPILVELFTSQSCLNCPPADEMLADIARRPGVVALEMHVDYWNNIGWTDPFSSIAFSERQTRYKKQLEAITLYTPMLVVGGAAHCIGSQEDDVETLLENSQKRPRAGRVRALPSLKDGKLTLDLEVTLAAATEKKLELFVAIAENDLRTPVSSGENVNRELVNHHVVRRLKKVAAVPKAAGASKHHFEIKLDKDWKSENLEAVAFLQDSKTLAIEGATRVALAAAP